MSDDSTSLSFLNLNWCESKQDTSLIYPFILEPAFTNFYLEITYKLEDLIKKIKLINFTYKITNDDTIKLVDINSKEILLEICVCEFNKVNFTNISNFKYFFVLNKLKYKKAITSRNNKLYKENNGNVKLENEYEELKKFIFDVQINNDINFIYIENDIDLLRELKNILKWFSTENKFIPKIKTFKKGKEFNYMEYILCKIPGISKCVAKNLTERFRSLENLNCFVQNNKVVELSEFIVEDFDNKKTRKLGLLQANKIYQVFTSKDKNEKIN